MDILRNWGGPQPGFLVIDALDAARSNYNVETLLTVVRQVIHSATRWRIVMSVREYDLKNIQDVQRLFAGEPNPEYQSEAFPKIRHVCVKVMSEPELRQVRDQALEIGRAWDTAPPRLHELLKNPFNLRLLAEILELSGGRADVTPVQTQVALLDLYWRWRIDRNDPGGRRTRALKMLVHAMVGTRSLNVLEQEVFLAFPADAEALPSLKSDRVLFEAVPPTVAGASPRSAFSHNIFFDYAVARLYLGAVDPQITQVLADGRNQDLFLAIRPSVEMALQRLWHGSQNNHRAFWDTGFRFQQSAGIRLIGKILVGQVAASEYRTLSDFEPLLLMLAAEETADAAISLLQYTVNAAFVLSVQRPTDFGLIGNEAAEWMALARSVATSNIARSAWVVHHLLTPLHKPSCSPTPEQQVNAGLAARELLRYGLSDDRARRATRLAIDVVCTTMHTAPAESVEVLRRCLSEQELEQWGHEHLPEMAEHLLQISEVDETLALEVASLCFHTRGSRDDRVSSGGRILSLLFNKSDLLNMARRRVVDAFRELLDQRPLLAIRILIQAVDHVIEEEHREYSKARVAHSFNLGGKQATLVPDASYIWTAGTHREHEEWFRLLQEFRNYLPQVASKNPELVNKILTALCERNRYAIIWRTLLEAAAQAPDSLGTAVQDMLRSPFVLGCLETRMAAGHLLSAIYSKLDHAARADIERAVMAIPDALRGHTDE